MKNETPREILNRDILLLELKRAEAMFTLKQDIHAIHESVKPINLIKSMFEDVTESTDIKEGIEKAGIGMASGYLLKKIIFGGTSNPIKKIIGFAFQALVSNMATKNAEDIKEKGIDIFTFIKALLTKNKHTQIEKL